MDLVCNFRKCRKKLTDVAWVTACSHIFCDEHGTKEFNRSNTCPACETKLNERLEVIRQDLQLSEQFKAMVLCGQKPETMIEIFSRAFSFWVYQVSQRTAYQEFLAKKERESSQQLENYYEQLLTRAKTEIASHKSQRSELRGEVEELNKKLHQLQEQINEKTRQYQKLQGMYDELRRKSINPFSAGDSALNADRRASPPAHRALQITSLTSGDLRRKASPARDDCDFLFRPRTTPVIDSLSHVATPRKLNKKLFQVF